MLSSRAVSNKCATPSLEGCFKIDTFTNSLKFQQWQDTGAGLYKVDFEYENIQDEEHRRTSCGC